ncbi:hypothetical protein COOONC_03230 [Cooperia oncophora]
MKNEGTLVLTFFTGSQQQFVHIRRGKTNPGRQGCIRRGAVAAEECSRYHIEKELDNCLVSSISETADTKKYSKWKDFREDGIVHKRLTHVSR